MGWPTVTLKKPVKPCVVQHFKNLFKDKILCVVFFSQHSTDTLINNVSMTLVEKALGLGMTCWH